ncbi:MAG: hypothetical protein ACREE2_03930 [Stellaceae bacterium]
MTAAPVMHDRPWWKEPAKDQWYAFVAAWLDWTFDACADLPVLAELYTGRDRLYRAAIFYRAGIFAGGGMFGQVPSYLTERFPTEIRGTATGFCYHVGAIPGAMVPPILTYFAIDWHLGFAIPMLISTLFGLINFILSVAFGPQTRGTEMVPDLVVA